MSLHQFAYGIRGDSVHGQRVYPRRGDWQQHALVARDEYIRLKRTEPLSARIDQADLRAGKLFDRILLTWFGSAARVLMSAASVGIGDLHRALWVTEKANAYFLTRSPESGTWPTQSELLRFLQERCGEAEIRFPFGAEEREKKDSWRKLARGSLVGGGKLSI